MSLSMNKMFEKIFEYDGIKIKDKRVLALCASNKEDVIKAVNGFTEKDRGTKAEEELCSIVNHYKFDDRYLSLWAIVALGQMCSRVAISSLLKVIDSDWDYWKEAAGDALTKITNKFGETVLDELEEFIGKRLNNDPFSSRLFTYGPISILRNSERAKKFLIRMFQEDDTWKSSIAHDLAGFGDKRILHLFCRAIQFADDAGDDYALIELREAYCILDGVEFSYMKKNRKESWEEPFEERWKHKLKELGKSEEELEKEEERRDKKTKELIYYSENDKEFLAKIQKENSIRDNYSLCDFEIETYLSIRERNFIESDFEELLRILGFDENITVEEVQKYIGKTINFQEALEFATKKHKVFPSEEAMHQFQRKFTELWNITPKEPYQGLTPENVMELSDDGLRIAPKIGRNDPCSCGSGKKYKKCCGKNN